MTTTTMYLDQINKISVTIIIENYIHEHLINHEGLIGCLSRIQDMRVELGHVL